MLSAGSDVIRPLDVGHRLSHSHVIDSLESAASLTRQAPRRGILRRAQPSTVLQKGTRMSAPRKPSIVFCHGIWADGSCFSKLIPPLRAGGYEVIAAQYNLDSAQSDIDAVIRTLDRVSSPSILV